MTRATGTSPADSASNASSSRVASKCEPPPCEPPPKSTPTRIARGKSKGVAALEPVAVMRSTVSAVGGAPTRATSAVSGLLRRLGGVEVHRAAGHDGRDRVLVDHLRHGV